MTLLNFPDLFGDRLQLVGLDRSSIPRLHVYSSNPKFFEFFEFSAHTSVEQTELYFDKLQSRSNNMTGHYWLIQLQNQNLTIGTFGVFDIDLRKRSAEIGYGLDPDYWGKGYFTESLTVVINYLFETQNFHRVFAKTHSNNVNSIMALEKYGFVNEGRMRDFYKSDDSDQYFHAEILALIAGDRH